MNCLIAIKIRSRVRKRGRRPEAHAKRWARHHDRFGCGERGLGTWLVPYPAKGSREDISQVLE